MKSKIADGLYAAFDIGNESIRAVIIEITGSSRRIATIEHEALKPLSVFPVEEEYFKQVAESIKKLSDRLPISSCKSVSSLFANRELQVKIIELPNQVQEEQIDKIINWEAKKLLSITFQEEPYAFAYRIVKKNPYCVAVAVIPLKMLEKFIMLFSSAGIKLDGVYAEVFGADALKENIDINNLAVASIINFGNSGTHLQIFSSGELRFYRFIPSGSAEMAVPPTNNELEMYAQKIRFSFDYFRAVSKLNQVDKILFMGEGAMLPGVLPFAKDYFNPSKTGIVDISSGMDITPILSELADCVSATEERHQKLLPFLPAVGAAISGMAEQADCTNLLTVLKKQKKEIRMMIIAKTLPSYICGVCTIIAIVILLGVYGKLSGKLEKVQVDIRIANISKEVFLTKISKLESNMSTEAKLSPLAKKAIKPILGVRLGMDQLLFAMSKYAPKGLNIEELLIRSAAEAKDINFEDQTTTTENDYNYSGADDAGKSEFISSLVSQSPDVDQLKEHLTGEWLIIKGIALNNSEIGQFMKSLSVSRIIKRYKSIVSQKKRGSGFQFLIKGELP